MSEGKPANVAIFLDRDGVLIGTRVENGRPYAITAGEKPEILPSVEEACAALKRAGFLLVMATNQPDVATGKTPLAFVEETNAMLAKVLSLDDIEVCYHQDGDNCSCRKPKPGMLLTAAAKLDIDLARSVMVGDRWRDIEAGQNVGCLTVLVDYGYTGEKQVVPDLAASSLSAAVDWIGARAKIAPDATKGACAMSGWKDYLDSSTDVLGRLRASLDPARVEKAVEILTSALAANKPLLVCGNGGSAADSMHIAGELVGRFGVERRALKVISLAADSAVMTAWANDYDYKQIFARQVEAYGEAGGVLLVLSTSGKSPNVLAAVAAAKTKAMTTIALTGQGGAALAPLVDILLDVPSTSTPLIQQAHLCLYHYLCAEVEKRIAKGA